MFTTMTRGLSGQQHGVLHRGEAPCDAYDRCPRVVVREENGNMLLRSDQDRTGAECLPNTRMLQTLKKRPLLEVVVLLILLSFSFFCLSRRFNLGNVEASLASPPTLELEMGCGYVGRGGTLRIIEESPPMMRRDNLHSVS